MMEIIASLLAAAGGQIAAVIAGIVAVVGAIFYHKTKVSSAEKTGRDDGAAIERDRIEAEASREINKIKDRARETRAEVRAADPDALAERMRRGATDYRDL